MDADKLAAAVNKLALDVTRAKQLINEDALVILLALHSRVGMKSIRDVLKAIERLPERTLTPQGRAIRIRED